MAADGRARCEQSAHGGYEVVREHAVLAGAGFHHAMSRHGRDEEQQAER